MQWLKVVGFHTEKVVGCHSEIVGKLRCLRFVSAALYCVLWCSFLTVSPPMAVAQQLNSAQLSNSPEINRAGIERRLEELQATNSGLDAETISQLSLSYNATLISLDDKDNYLAKKALYQKVITQGEQTIARLEQTLKSLQSSPPAPTIPEADWSAADIQNLFDETNADLAAVKTTIANLDSEKNAQYDDALAIRQRLDAIKQEQDSTAKELQVLDASTDESQVKQAKRWANNAKINALRAEVDMLDLALISKPTRTKIMTLERAIQHETEMNLQTNIEQIQEKLNQQRNKEAQESLGITEKASFASGFESQEIQGYAKKNQELSSELATLTNALNSATLRNKELNNTYDYVKTDYELLEQKAAVAGLSRVYGQVLIEQRNRLPKTAEFIKEQEHLNEKITAAALRRLELSSNINQSYSVDDEARALINSLPSADADAVAAIKNMTEYRRTLLVQLDDSNSVYVRALTESDYTLTQLTRVLKDLDNHLLKQLMWVRTYKSITQISWEDITNEFNTYRQITQSFSVKDIINLYLGKPWLYLSLALVLLICAFLKTLKKYKISYLDKTINPDFSSVVISLKYLGCVALQSSLVTIIVVHVFYLIFSLLTPTTVYTPVISAYFYCFFVDYITRLLAPNEMFARYFRWPDEVVANLYRGFLVLRNVFLSLMLITLTNNSILVNETGGIVGALLVTSMYLIFAFTIHQVFSVRYNITLSIIKRSIYGKPSTQQKILHYLLVFSFIAWAGFFLVGYRYSAALISSRIFESMLVFAYVVVAHQIALRWLTDLELREYFRFKQQTEAEASPPFETNSEGINIKSAQPAPAEKL